MSETMVAHDGTNHVCYVTTTGRDRDYLGCAHRTPREAIDHAPASRTAADETRVDLLGAVPVAAGLRRQPSSEALDPASRSAVEPFRSRDGDKPRQSETLDHPTAQRLDMGSPDGSDGSGTASLPVASHQATSMSGTFWS